MPSSSARCSQLPRAIDKVPFYNALRKFRDHLNGKLPDLDDSEITFPDLELKTAKKEPKEEVKEEFPGENPDMGGEAALQQMLGGAYQVIPHTQHSTYHDPQGNNTFSSQGLPQINQEPGTCPPLPQLQPMVAVKQEPGLETPSSCPSQMQASYQSQGYNNGQQPLVSCPSSNGNVDSFMNGINGLMEKFGNPSQYGVVQQTGSAGNRPVQFNDALCDILTEGSSFELVQQPSSEPPPQEKPTSKKSKAKKRKSAESSSSPHSVGESAALSNSQSPQSVSQSPDLSRAPSLPICQPLPVYAHPAHPAFTQGYPMYPPSFSQPSISQPGPDFQGNPHVTQPSSYAQMMNVSLPYPGGHIPFTTHGYMPPPDPSMQAYSHPGQFAGQYPGQAQFSDLQGQYQGPMPPQAVNVKQEKTDEENHV